MIWVAIALASAGISIACGVTLPAAEEAVVQQNGNDPDHNASSILGATLPAPHAAEDAAVVVQQPPPSSSEGGMSSGAIPATPRLYFVFVTSGEWAADKIEGLSGADEKCRNLADNSFSLRSRHWVAWLSDGTTAAPSRLGTTPGPWVKLNMLKIAETKAQLVDPATPLANAIDLDENIGFHNDDVWTGTLANGTSSTKTCQQWNGTTGQGVYGAISKSKPDWTNKGETDCEWRQSWGNNVQVFTPKKRLYCFEID
jgi:hypothetical protein